MEIIKCKKTNIIVFILSVLFLMSACAFGQPMSVDRIDSDNKDYGKVSKLFPSYGLFFKYSLPKKEELSISISADSINPEVISPILYVYFPNSVNGQGANIFITFADGEKVEFRQINCTVDNYAEYEITERGFSKLRYGKFKTISFGKFGTYTDEETDFFMKFFRLIHF